MLSERPVKALVIILATLLLIGVACSGSESEEEESATPIPFSTPTLRLVSPPVPSVSAPSSSTTTTPSTSTSPKAILESSIATMEQVETFHFEMDINLDLGDESAQIQLPFNYIGNFQKPDRTQATLKITILSIDIVSNVIIVGNASYVTNPATGEWETSPGGLLPVNSPAELISIPITEIDDLTLLGVETLNGVEVYHMRGSTQPAAIFQSGPTVGQITRLEGEMQLEYWVGVDDLYIRRLLAEGQTKSISQVGASSGAIGDTDLSVVVDLSLSDFGKPVEIVPPEVGSTSIIPRPSTSPNGPGERIDELARDHVNQGQSHIAYNSAPATSGPHFGAPLAPVRWGVHGDVLPDEVLLHNLEHGGISVTYNCPGGCDELVGQLADFVENAVRSGRKVMLSPYPGMTTRVALTAWTFIDRFDDFDQRRIQAFVDAHESSPNSPEPNAR